MPLFKFEKPSLDFNPEVDMYLPTAVFRKDMRHVFKAVVNDNAHIVILNHGSASVAVVPYHHRKDNSDKSNVEIFSMADLRSSLSSIYNRVEKGEFIVAQNHNSNVGTLVPFKEYRKRLNAYNKQLEQ